MNQTKKMRLFLMTGLLFVAGGFAATANTINAKANTELAVVEVATDPAKVWTEQELRDGLESLWWYEEERSLVLFDGESFYYVETGTVPTLSAAVEAMQQPAFAYEVEEFFPEEGKMAVARTTTTGFDEEYTIAPDGKTMEVHFPEPDATYTYVYVGEKDDIADVLRDKMSGGAVEVVE